MAWTKLDDNFHSHPKVLAAGNAGAGLYCRALAYCAAYGTDGRVPVPVAQSLAAGERRGRVPLERVLEDAGLWRLDGDAYLIPDYLELNPSSAEVEERRSKRAAAGAVGGKRSGEVRRARRGKPDALAGAVEREVKRAPRGPRKANARRWLEALEGGA